MRVAVLGSCTALAACLFWGSLGGDDGITEVLAHRSEILPGRFIEVPCSEDYDSHRRFEGTQCQGDSGKSSMLTWNSVCSKCICFYFDELVGIRLKVVWGWGDRRHSSPLPTPLSPRWLAHTCSGECECFRPHLCRSRPRLHCSGYGQCFTEVPTTSVWIPSGGRGGLPGKM